MLHPREMAHLCAVRRTVVPDFVTGLVYGELKNLGTRKTLDLFFVFWRRHLRNSLNLFWIYCNLAFSDNVAQELNWRPTESTFFSIQSYISCSFSFMLPSIFVTSERSVVSVDLPPWYACWDSSSECLGEVLSHRNLSVSLSLVFSMKYERLMGR